MHCVLAAGPRRRPKVGASRNCDVTLGLETARAELVIPEKATTWGFRVTGKYLERDPAKVLRPFEESYITFEVLCLGNRAGETEPDSNRELYEARLT